MVNRFGLVTCLVPKKLSVCQLQRFTRCMLHQKLALGFTGRPQNTFRLGASFSAVGVPLSECRVVQYLIGLTSNRCFAIRRNGRSEALWRAIGIAHGEHVGGKHAIGIYPLFDATAPFIIFLGRVVVQPHLIHIDLVETCPKPAMISCRELAVWPNALARLPLCQSCACFCAPGIF